ncbi:hypothetical protein [Pseudarthrobacter sp. BIM B-2242]|uniref:hypothetical protein n=1 Tax=Pseudarthrobacter sp. BIM B-2242 TaxID=2772401 RepID=UPI00168BD66F|nr:hypothetical protein [Pseudarthrobacter sp. BIM B-2242]QOD06033.1 hypothetical protein IDT60_20935 [Pseudarthrobacter sp. BIM B-2242]
MSTLSHTHVRREPTQFRVTVIENDDDLHYLGRTYDIHPYKDGCIVRYIDRDGMEQERVPLLGMYLTEELDQDGQVTRTHQLLTFQEYNEQFVERGDPNLIYGVRAAGGSHVEVTRGTLESARIGVQLFNHRHPLGKFEVVSLPRDTDTDDSTWTVVGH